MMAKTLSERVRDSLGGGSEKSIRALLERLVYRELNLQDGQLVERIDPGTIADLCNARGWTIEELHAQLRSTTAWTDMESRAAANGVDLDGRTRELQAELVTLEVKVKKLERAKQRRDQARAEIGDLQRRRANAQVAAVKLGRLEEAFPLVVPAGDAT